ncbi:MAG TPA: hypothetical protein PKY59_17900, partial [Pyrinomonadaceae bacterium]|nr:hypothetical protein [Pyrinomonadaceae bacterium]
MAYCHECGSEVAPNDVYCPFCGIFMNLSAPVETNADSTENAVVETKNEQTALNEVSKEIELAETALDSDFTANENSSEILPPTENTAHDNYDFSLSDTEESFDLKDVKEEYIPQTDETFEKQPEEPITPPIAEASENIADYQTDSTNDSVDFSLDNIPTPSLIDENSQNYGVPFQKTEEKQEEIVSEIETQPEMNEPAESVSIPEEHSDSDVENEKTFDIETPLEVVAQDEVSEEVEQTTSAENTEISLKEQKDPFSETIPDMSSAFVSKEEIETTNEENPVVEAKDEEIVDFSQTEQASEELKPEIEKPSEELQTPDLHVSQAVFDSVRIMETKPEKNEEKAELPIASSFVESIAQTGETEKPVSENLEDSKENLSYTTPNIGGSDTDGKKAKLKPLDEGTILNGRYEIIRKIGGGGM